MSYGSGDFFHTIQTAKEPVEPVKPNLGSDWVLVEVSESDDLETLDKLFAGQGFNYVVAGGAVRVAAMTKETKFRPNDDVDLFFYTQEDYDSVVSYLNRKPDINNGKYDTWTCIWDKETTVSHIYLWAIPGTEDGMKFRLNLIKPSTVQFKTLVELVSQFDFSVNRIALLDKSWAIADKDFLKDELEGKLQLKFIHCCISGVSRIAKYIKKGYHCPLSEIVKLFKDWDSRSADYKDNVLKIVSEEATVDQKEIAYRLMYRD